jgi:peptidoglycan/LPS O-acetylase OafA/YrhL
LRPLENASLVSLAVLIVLVFVATIAIASMSWFGVERPLQRRSGRSSAH